MVIAAGCVLVLFIIRQLQSISSGCGFEVMYDRCTEQNQPRHSVRVSAQKYRVIRKSLRDFRPLR